MQIIQYSPEPVKFTWKNEESKLFDDEDSKTSKDDDINDTTNLIDHNFCIKYYCNILGDESQVGLEENRRFFLNIPMDKICNIVLNDLQLNFKKLEETCNIFDLANYFWSKNDVNRSPSEKQK